MMEFNKSGLYKALMIAMAASALVACGSEDGDNGATGTAGQAGAPGSPGVKGDKGDDASVTGRLTRIATVPTGAEVTGMFMTENGDLFFNAQHPSSANVETDGNATPYNKGTVGVIEGFSFNEIPADKINLPVPIGAEMQLVQTAYGQYKILGQNGDAAKNGGTQPEGKLGSIRKLDNSAEVTETDMPDFNAYLPIPNKTNEGYLYTNWEDRPGGMSRMHLKKENGKWTVLDAMMVDFAAVQGTGANCFGSVSPWGTPLTSEEWVISTKVDTTTHPDWNKPGSTSAVWDLADTPANPYDFGYIVEISKPLEAAPVPVKHYTIGRYEHENSTVMPDAKTVYSSQDDDGGVLFKFVADTAEDLSAGTLYGAKLTQDAGKNDPATTGFDVEWVALASSDNATIEAWINEFDGIGTDQWEDGKTSYMTVKDVEAWAAWVKAGRPATGHTYPTVENGGGKVTAGKPMDDRSAFIESRQAARQLGATAEWRKLEGISINHKRVKEAVTGEDLIADEKVTAAYLYMGNADTDKTMIDEVGDIRLSSRVKDCGTIYRAKILADYNINRIDPVLTGSTYRTKLSGADKCDVNGITNPDNVIVLNNGSILIGEDAGSNRDNDTLWMYEPKK